MKGFDFCRILFVFFLSEEGQRHPGPSAAGWGSHGQPDRRPAWADNDRPGQALHGRACPRQEAVDREDRSAHLGPDHPEAVRPAQGQGHHP